MYLLTHLLTYLQPWTHTGLTLAQKLINIRSVVTQEQLAGHILMSGTPVKVLPCIPCQTTLKHDIVFHLSLQFMWIPFLCSTNKPSHDSHHIHQMSTIILLCSHHVVYSLQWSLYLSCAHCCLSNGLDRPSNQFLICLWTDRFWSNYVHNSLLIFTKFCMRLRYVIASTPIVCETNRSSLPL